MDSLTLSLAQLCTARKRGLGLWLQPHGPSGASAHALSEGLSSLPRPPLLRSLRRQPLSRCRCRSPAAPAAAGELDSKSSPCALLKLGPRGVWLGRACCAARNWEEGRAAGR